MVTFSNILIVITTLFVLYVALRFILKLKICALCAAVSTTWLGLLGIKLFGFDIDPLIIGILMGGSAVGIMYLLEQKTPKKYHILKLPFLLTLFALTYIVLADVPEERLTYLILLSLWVVFLSIFFMERNIRILKKVGKKLIECCKNW